MNRTLALLLLICMVAGCPWSEHSPSTFDDDVFRVAVLPDQSEQILRARYGPLIEYLQNTTGVEMELLIPTDYETLIRWFKQGHAHMAWFGGYTFVEASEEDQAAPLVMRDVDMEFTTDLLARRSSTAQTIDDFSGRTLAFGPVLSTSGHLMPRHFFHQRGIEPEQFFQALRHSSGHDQTAVWVQDGVVDLGAVNSVIVESMFKDGRLNPQQVCILMRTPPYKNYVWAVQPDLDRRIHRLLLDAFLAMDRSVPEHARILNGLGARAYLPASRSDHDQVRDAIELIRHQTQAFGRSR